MRSPLALAVLGMVLAVPGIPVPAADDPNAQSIAPPPSPDDPPALTRSGKVHARRDAARPPALGPEDAKVVVVLFSDFQCPVCARIPRATRQLPEEFPGEVRIEFWNFAPPTHPLSEGAAVAALAAHRQGKFWKMHDTLFAEPCDLYPAALRRTAEAIGLDLARFDHDVADPALRERVRRETADAKRLGVTGSPGYLVNGRLFVGWASWHGFRTLVEQELTAVNALLAERKKAREIPVLRARANAKDAEAFAAYQAIVLGPAERR